MRVGNPVALAWTFPVFFWLNLSSNWWDFGSILSWFFLVPFNCGWISGRSVGSLYRREFFNTESLPRGHGGNLVCNKWYVGDDFGLLRLPIGELLFPGRCLPVLSAHFMSFPARRWS